LPTEASFTCLDFFGRKVILFVWTNDGWNAEQNKPAESWPIRDGRIRIIPAMTGPAPHLEVRPWAGRAERFGVAKTLEIEVRVNGIVAVYNVAPATDDDAVPSPHTIPLTGNGGIASVAITCRKDLFGKLG
jgi:hypothetical protein